MSRFREIFGIDGKDFTIHVGATVVAVVLVAGAGAELNYDGEAVATLLGAASAALLGLRMFLGRRKHQSLPRAEDHDQLNALDDRLSELEQERARLHELEERVDFAERLLVAKREAPPRSEEGR